MTESGPLGIELARSATGTRSALIAQISCRRRLLILACSERKIPVRGPLVALERYDGPAFRVLRRYLRQVPVTDVAIYILSAEHGLIESEFAISAYDRRMTSERAQELRPAITAKLQALLQQSRFREAFICAGSTYRKALTGVDNGNTLIRWAKRGLGGRLTELRDWLREPVQ